MKRYEEIDILKGFAVILMIIYHIFYFPNMYGFKEIEYKEIALQVPINSEKYLELTYGLDWKTPKKDYIWYEDACNLKRD